jgi:hypothetical protein
MKKANGIENYATSGEYEPRPYNWRKENKIAPHHLWRSKTGVGHNRAILVCQRRKDHWSINESAIDFIYMAEFDRQTIDKGYVILIDRDGSPVAYHTISEVHKAVHSASLSANPGTGEFGNYFFVDAKLNVVAPGEFHVEDNI